MAFKIKRIHVMKMKKLKKQSEQLVCDNKKLKQAWLNVLAIEPKSTVRLNARQAQEIALEYGKLLCEKKQNKN